MTTFLQRHDVSTPSFADRRKSLSSPTSLAHRLLLFLAVMLMGVNGVWGQTTAVTFNNDVRYSQWIMDSRLPDFKGNTNQMGFPIYETNGDVKTNASTWDKKDTDKTAKNDYVAGLVAKAAIENAIYYGAFDWSKSYYRAVEWYTQNIADVPTSGGSLDNLNPSKMFFGLYNAANGSFSGIANANTKSNATTQLGKAITGLAYYNTNYAFGTTNYSITSVDGKDVAGGWFHKHESDAAKSYDNEMWCDGQYMGPALLAQLIANKSTLGLADNTVLDWNIVAKQFTITWNQLWNETDGLLYHAFTGDRTTSISHGWSLDDGVYHSKAYWGRAVGWYMLGLVDVLEQMPSTNGNYATLKGYLDKLAAGVARYQTTNGVWYQVMDEKNSALTGNYEEASCSAIFAAAYLKAIRLNLISATTTPANCSNNYQTIATNAYQGVVSQFMKFDISDKAKVHLVNSCASAGLGGDKKRSGERSYYINGSDVTKITNYTEGKPLGAFIMAATEYEQLYQSGLSLKFTSDLAPTYTCNGTTDALKAEAMGGNTTPTYQWYKNSQAIPSATSSSYIPTESGNYYCVANGGNTIQTSTAVVTVAAAPEVGELWTVTNATYNSTSKGYEVANIGTYYKSTSPGTSTINTNSTAQSWQAGSKYLTTGSSTFIFSPSQAVTAIKLYVIGRGNTTSITTTKANSINGTYSDLNSTSTSDTKGATENLTTKDQNSIITITFASSVGANDYIKFVGSQNLDIYGIELITVPTTPEITIATQPQGGSSAEFATATAMTVVASASNGSTCTYQWQSASSENGTYTDISNATSASYTVGNTGVSDKWYHCVVSAEGCTTKTTNNVRYQVTGGSSTVSNLTKIETNYTYTPDAALPASTMTSDSKILAVDGGNSYVQNFGLSFKSGRQIAFKVAAGATVTANLYNNGNDVRTAVLATSPGHSNDAVQSQAVPNTDSRTATLTFTPTTDATYYLCGASDLYLQSLNITFSTPQSSEKTPTAVSGGTIDGTVITATEVASANAGQAQTVTLTLPAGATASMQNDNGTGATITSAGVLTYNALAAGTNSSITIRITAEDGTTQDYTVNVSTAAAGGAETEYATISKSVSDNIEDNIWAHPTINGLTFSNVAWKSGNNNFKGSAGTYTIAIPDGVLISKIVVEGIGTSSTSSTLAISGCTTETGTFNNSGSTSSTYVVTTPTGGQDFTLTVSTKEMGITSITLYTGSNTPSSTPATGVTLNQTSSTLSLGEQVTLTETVAPADATNKNVTWESSNTAVATVENGVVKAVGTGSATITVKTEDGNHTATCTIESILGKKDFSNDFAADTRTGDFVLTSGQSRRIQFTAHGDNANNVTWILNAFSGSNKAGEAFMALRADQWDNVGDANSTRKLSNTNWDQFKEDYSNGMDVDLYVTNSGKRLYVYGTMTAKTGSRTYKYTAETVEHNCGTAKLSLQAENSWIENLVIGDMVTAYPVVATAINGTVAITNDNGMAVNSGTCFINGSALHLVATPTAEDPFNGWSDGDNNATRDITVNAAKNLVATFGTIKQDITRFSPKGGTVNNSLYVGQNNYPDVYIAPFTAESTILSTSDFTISSSDESVATVEWHTGVDGGVTNTLNGDMRSIHLTVIAHKAGTARITYTFKGNSEYNEKSNFIDYTVLVKRTITYDANTGTNAPAAAYCGDGQTTTAPAVGTMAKNGYEFAGWNTAADGSGTNYASGDVITINADVTLYAQWTPVGQQVLYSYEVAAGQSAVTDAEAIGGTFTSAIAGTSDGNIKFSSSSSNVKLNLNKALAVGDVIKITMSQNSTSSAAANAYGIGVATSTASTDVKASLYEAEGTDKAATVLTYTVTADDGLAGNKELYLQRLGEKSVYFYGVEITRVAQAGTDATIKNVRMNNHNIPEIDGQFSYSIGALNGNNFNLDVFVTPNDSEASVAIKDYETNENVTFNAGKFTATVGRSYIATVTATDGETAEDYQINVGMAINLGSADADKYAVQNVIYYEGQQMSAKGVDIWYSLSAGNDNQLSFPIHQVTNPVDNDYQYRIVNSSGASPVYSTTTGVPESGAYYKVTPSQAGMLTVAVQLNADKPLIVSNGAKVFVAGYDYKYDLRSMDDGATVTLDNNNKANVNVIGTVTFSVSEKDYYLYAGGSKLSLMGFSLNTEIPKYTVTATANPVAGGSVSINSGTIISGSLVDAGTALSIVATPATDYKFTGWTNSNGEVISTQSTYIVDALNADINITAQFAATGIVTATATFPLDVMKGFGNSAGDTFTNYDTGNAATANVTLSTSSGDVQGQNSSDGTKVRRTGTFTITPAAGRTIKSIVIHTNGQNPERILESSPEDEPTVSGANYTYTINTDGTVTFTNPSNSGGNIYVTAIDVVYEYQAGTEKVQYLGSFPANSSINDYIGVEYSVPALTVTSDGSVVESSKYNVVYSSSNESVATVEDGKITLVGAGSTTIVATITPTGDNTNIIGSTASIAVTSKALEALEVSISDLTINNTDAEYEIPVPVVKVGDKTLAANEYTVSYTEIDDTKNIVTANGSQLSINGSERNWTAGTASVKITVTPTAAAKEKYHCVASASANFNITVVSAQSKRQPVIDMLDEITVNTGTDQAITFGVLYDGNNLNDIFDFSYVVTKGSTSAALKSSNKNIATVSTGSTAGDATITVTATPKKIINSDGEVEVDYADIYESATKTVTIHIDALKIFQSVTVTPSSVSFATGNTQALTLTVKDENGDVLDEDEYTAIWSSNNPGVASVNAKGVVTGVSEGDAVLTVVVITEGYEGKNVTVDVQVTDPSMYKAVTGSKTYTTGTVLDTDNKNIEVTLGGWTFPATVKAGTTQETFGISSDEFNPNSNLWKDGNTSGLKLTGFKCYADGVADMKNPRNENGSNSQPESTTIYDKTIVAQDGMTTIDPMFNVPCAGSYVVFAPKTNGTVTAYIYQNGAFESNSKSGATANTEFSYRPQRRVFIIDEAGQFVPSTAKLETTSGFKMPTYKGASSEKEIKKGDVNTNLNDYIWDLAGVAGAPTLYGTDGKAPTAADVVSHFEGLESFDPANVVNGVYQPSTVLDAALHNNISDLSQPGARGWVVLVPAPVIYTFNVQAGKTYHLYNFGSKIGLYGFKFVEDEVTVDEVEFSEADAAPKKTQAGHVAKVNISDRTFKNGVWNAGVLPFSLNKQQVDAIFGHTYDKDNTSGTQIMYFDRVEDDKIIFVRHSYNTIVAGKPFIIKPAKGSEVTINTADVTKFPYVTIEEEGTPALWGRNNGSGFMWRSSYSTVVGGIKQGDYYLNTSGDVSRRASASAVNIKGFRGWLQAQSKTASAKILTVGFDSFLDDDDDNIATDLNLIMDNDGNIVELPKNGIIYNMSGVAVSTDPSKLYNLPTGLYILNGKKYYVK